MKCNYDNIVNPRKALPSIFNKVMPLYLKDYGSENIGRIHKRLSEAIYIFDSNPVDTWGFVKKHQDEIHDKRFYDRCLSEYKDYMRIEEDIDYKIDKAFRKFLKREFDIVADKDYPVMNINFNIYSTANKDKYHNGSEEERREIEILRSDYFSQCREAGFQPITYDGSIHDIVNFQTALNNYKMMELTKRTKWAKRIKREVSDLYHFDLTDESFINCFFDDIGNASAGLEKDKKGNQRTVMFLPIISNLKFEDVDKVFLHELRHVVEAGSNGFGLYQYRSKKYDRINEIHTEKNAILDCDALKSSLFFEKSHRVRKSAYELFFPYLGSLFEDYKMSFDLYAFHNRVDLLERCLGERFLGNLENKLHDIHSFEDEKVIRLKRNN